MVQAKHMIRPFMDVALICSGLFGLFFAIDQWEQSVSAANTAETVPGSLASCPLMEGAEHTQDAAKIPLMNGTGL